MNFIATTLKNIDEDMRFDFDFELDAMFDVLLQAQEIGMMVQIDSVAVDTDDVLEHNYYDITLANGMRVEAIAGYHLEEIIPTGSSI